MSDIALIQGMENVLDPVYATLDEHSPLYTTHRRNSAVMTMAISHSPPSAFVTTADLELDASPLQIAQTITEYFTDATTEAHLLLK